MYFLIQCKFHLTFHYVAAKKMNGETTKTLIGGKTSEKNWMRVHYALLILTCDKWQQKKLVIGKKLNWTFIILILLQYEKLKRCNNNKMQSRKLFTYSLEISCLISFQGKLYFFTTSVFIRVDKMKRNQKSKT